MSTGNCSPIIVITGIVVILEDVANHQHPLAEPLRPRSADVVLAQHLQHHGASKSHRYSRQQHTLDE